MLYLALEDPLTRLQNRLLSITEEAPNNLKFAIKSETILGGLKEQIEDFCSQHKDTRFIVIDTLQKIREQKESANQYAQDYKDMNVLKDLAMQFNISILLVHHLRKLEASDPLDMLSCSTGLSGEAYRNLFLKNLTIFKMRNPFLHRQRY